MARVTVEDCLENVSNRFELVLVASKRARQIARGMDPLVDPEGDKVAVIALREIAAKLIDKSILEEQQAMPRVVIEDIEVEEIPQEIIDETQPSGELELECQADSEDSSKTDEEIKVEDEQPSGELELEGQSDSEDSSKTDEEIKVELDSESGAESIVEEPESDSEVLEESEAGLQQEGDVSTDSAE